ncbi:hypothetical protein [Desulfoscipio geothermicus]|uniref:Uncharacterized protein n=1 Tax=Desulfoscipio geothermicus DSM 3669 TaxID=1121426 RepID=A0A1I6ECN8_9FIRM|nr:hypothetical protein [Desulfoscipio geothermicus]SFR15282.1 hypothetical protein SAMN05660706_13510 [Desulfoscipio geothermicus DSM 3669]
MVERKSWEEFRTLGFLWWINMILHTFGWAITFDFDDSGKLKEVYPARVKYRGFSEKINSEGYIKVSEFMKANAEQLHQESME